LRCCLMTLRKYRGTERLEMDGLDHAVGEGAVGDLLKRRLVEFSVDDIRPAGSHGADGDAHVADGHFGAGGDGVHDAGFQMDFDAAGGLRCWAVAMNDFGGFDQRIREKLASDAADGGEIGIGVEEKNTGGLDGIDRFAEVADLVEDGLAERIGIAAGANVDAVNHVCKDSKGNGGGFK